MTFSGFNQLQELNQPPPGDDAGGAVQIRRVDGARHLWALSLLLTGHGREDDPVAVRFADFAAEQQYDLDLCWVSFEAGVANAAVMVIPSPGRTGMVFLSPMNRMADAPVIARLLEHAAVEADRTRCRLIQALLDPPQRLELEALKQAAFSHLAHLLYMHMRTPRRMSEAALEPGLAVQTWSEALRPRFERAILSTYEQTQDCPSLVGRRTIEDIVAGHMASGVFDPQRWYLIEKGDEPVGVMLLNRSSQHAAMEIVYFGLAASWRGRGLGRRLLQHALRVAREDGLSQLLLAVDEANEPAMSLYRGLGFVGHARKVAMMRALD